MRTHRGPAGELPYTMEARDGALGERSLALTGLRVHLLQKQKW